MRVLFWGTRGSLSASLSAREVEAKVVAAVMAARGRDLGGREQVIDFVGELPFFARGTYGTNTSCVEIEGGEEYVVCDAGSGLRDFGNHVMQSGGSGPLSFHLFISHLHWDHIQGFPFFVPAYIPGTTINIYGMHPELEAAFINQQAQPNFPVPFAALGAEIRFQVLEPKKSYEIAGFVVEGAEQSHPGRSFSYSFFRDGKRVVYSTDAEHKGDAEKESYQFLRFISRADLLVFDAQYTLMDAIYSKEDWGHSSNITGVELAIKAGVKHLCLFHSEPTSDDRTLEQILNNTRKYAAIFDNSSRLEITMAYDGLEIDV